MMAKVVAGVVAVALAGGGYAYGHREGGQESEWRAMSLFFERCAVPEAPAVCGELMSMLTGNGTATDLTCDPPITAPGGWCLSADARCVFIWSEANVTRNCHHTGVAP